MGIPNLTAISDCKSRLDYLVLHIIVVVLSSGPRANNFLRQDLHAPRPLLYTSSIVAPNLNSPRNPSNSVWGWKHKWGTTGNIWNRISVLCASDWRNLYRSPRGWNVKLLWWLENDAVRIVHGADMFQYNPIQSLLSLQRKLQRRDSYCAMPMVRIEIFVHHSHLLILTIEVCMGWSLCKKFDWFCFHVLVCQPRYFFHE